MMEREKSRELTALALCKKHGGIILRMPKDKFVCQDGREEIKFEDEIIWVFGKATSYLH